MTKYTYESVTGPVEIDVDPHWAAVLKSEDRTLQRSERKHRRPDHKYAPCEPLPLDELQYEGEWLVDRRDEIGAVELSADLERALQSLPKLQRRYFVLYRKYGYSYVEIAKMDGKDPSTVREAIQAADIKIRNFLE